MCPVCSARGTLGRCGVGNKSHRKHEQRRPRHQIHLSSASILATSLHRLGVQHPSPSRSQLRGLYPGHYGALLNAKTLPPGFLTSLRALACHHFLSLSAEALVYSGCLSFSRFLSSTPISRCIWLPNTRIGTPGHPRAPSGAGGAGYTRLHT